MTTPRTNEQEAVSVYIYEVKHLLETFTVYIQRRTMMRGVKYGMRRDVYELYTEVNVDT